MSIELALGIVALLSLVGNRILSLLVGLILRVPAIWLLPTVYFLDVIQIPFFYFIPPNPYKATPPAAIPFAWPFPAYPEGTHICLGYFSL